MRQEDFISITETSKKFEEAVVSVLKAIETKGWSVFQIYDVKERMAAKGFEAPPLKIVEFCSAKHANRLLSKNHLVSLCMPCKMNVIEENGQVKILGMRPTFLPMLFPEVTSEEAEEIEKDIKEIIENAK